jgi:hypothetical protein
MAKGGGRYRSGKHGTTMVVGALLSVLVLLFGCGSDDSNNDSLGAGGSGGGWYLAGQTGSLIPACGVAPLIAEGRSLPAGDALAILYTSGCPELEALASVARDGVDGGTVAVELVPLGDVSGTYLVRAGQSVDAGDYQLTYGQNQSAELHVEEEAPAPPRSVGPLRFLPSDEVCPSELRFELALDQSALAYAPLSRLLVSVDHGEEQLWVDYGALPVETGTDGSRGVLELPRCGPTDCLPHGGHELYMRVEIAGEQLVPEPLVLSFSVNCPPPSTADSSGESSDASCSIEGTTRSRGSSAELACITCLTWLALRRRRSKQR